MPVGTITVRQLAVRVFSKYRGFYATRLEMYRRQRHNTIYTCRQSLRRNPLVRCVPQSYDHLKNGATSKILPDIVRRVMRNASRTIIDALVGKTYVPAYYLSLHNLSRTNPIMIIQTESKTFGTFSPL